MSKPRNTRQKQSVQRPLPCMQLEELCLLLEDGLRLKAARRRMGVTNQQIESALSDLAELVAWSKRVQLILGEEIEAELYSKAMNGCVASQAKYLKRYHRRKKGCDGSEMI